MKHINGHLISCLYIFIHFTLISGTDVEPKNEVEKKLLKFLHKWRTGSPSIPLPKLDVINIRQLDGHYSGKAGFDIDYSTSAMKLTGMNTFSVVDIRVVLGNYGLYSAGELSIPKVMVTADNYKIQGKAFHSYNLKGSGKLYADFENIHIRFIMKISNNDTNSYIKSLNIDFSIQNLAVDLENSSWPINKVINRDGLKIIEGFREEILTAALESIVKSLNPYLENTTPMQLLDCQCLPNVFRISPHLAVWLYSEGLL